MRLWTYFVRGYTSMPRCTHSHTHIQLLTPRYTHERQLASLFSRFLPVAQFIQVVPLLTFRVSPGWHGWHVFASTSTYSWLPHAIHSVPPVFGSVSLVHGSHAVPLDTSPLPHGSHPVWPGLGSFPPSHLSCEPRHF